MLSKIGKRDYSQFKIYGDLWIIKIWKRLIIL